MENLNGAPVIFVLALTTVVCLRMVNTVYLQMTHAFKQVGAGRKLPAAPVVLSQDFQKTTVTWANKRSALSFQTVVTVGVTTGGSH